MKKAEKRALRSRWHQARVVQINTRLIQSTPAKPAWERGELADLVGVHSIDDRELVDLRGFPFYELRNVTWSLVDMSGSEHRKGRLTPTMLGTGSIGSSRSTFDSCFFDELDAGDANFQGRFTDCTFVGAKLDQMDFWNGTRLTSCTLRNTSLRRAKIRGDIHFIDCDFTGAKLSGADIGQVRFEGCRFDGANFDRASIMGVRFVRCSMEAISAKSVLVENNAVEDMPEPPFEQRLPKRWGASS